MAVSILPLANQYIRQFADFLDVDSKFASKAAFETAIQNSARIGNGWLAFCEAENQWFKANKTTGKAEQVGGGSFLPLSGGTVTGDLIADNFVSQAGNSLVSIDSYGVTISNSNGFLAADAGQFQFQNNGFNLLLKPAATLTGNTDIYFPNKSGTVALLSDITYTGSTVSNSQISTWNNKQDALGFTPENTANKSITLNVDDDVHFPTNKAVNAAINLTFNIATAYTQSAIALIDSFESNPNVIAAITGATYNSSNQFTSTISPSGGAVMKKGKFYKQGHRFYTATADNVIYRFPSGEDIAEFQTQIGALRADTVTLKIYKASNFR